LIQFKHRVVSNAKKCWVGQSPRTKRWFRRSAREQSFAPKLAMREILLFAGVKTKLETLQVAETLFANRKTKEKWVKVDNL
jgi:hypothetical protein